MVRVDAAKVSVRVNDSHWKPVLSLRDAKPDDAVFVLDPQNGSIRFGNGVYGAKPSVGSTITVSYRDGSGSSGSISKRIYDVIDLAKFWAIMREDAQILGWGSRRAIRRIRRRQ